MKLDVDLVRDILIEVEKHANGIRPVSGRSLELNTDWDVVYYHLTHLMDDDWIKASHHLGRNIGIERLTPKGHDALVAMRNDTVRMKAKQWLQRSGTQLTLEAVLQAVKSIVSSQTGGQP